MTAGTSPASSIGCLVLNYQKISMRNELLGQLTSLDIKEIVDTFFAQQYDAYHYISEMDDKEAGNLFEYTQRDEFYKDVLNRMKDNNHYKPPCKERYPVLLEQAEYVTNCTLNPDSRKAENVFIKSIVAYQLHEEGYTYSEIGRTIGMSHATIIHYVNKMDDMFSLPQMYTTEISQYEQFKEIADTI